MRAMKSAYVEWGEGAWMRHLLKLRVSFKKMNGLMFIVLLPTPTSLTFYSYSYSYSFLHLNV
jgi:hypothetical protein